MASTVGQSTGTMSLQQQLMSALTVVQGVDFTSIEPQILQVFGSKNPVSSLMEYAQYRRWSVKFIEPNKPRGPDHLPRFTIHAVVDGEEFSDVEAGNKKDGQRGAAFLAYSALVERECNKLKNLLQNGPQTHFDRMAVLSHQAYWNLAKSNPECLCGRKVLAAIIMMRSKADIGSVVALGTGNRCIGRGKLDLEGGTVNDSHAEVIVRRSFLRFLYQQLENYTPRSNSAIFEPTVGGKLRLKDDVTFHLYISTAPCGDASVFSRQSDAVSMVNNQYGLLRTKIEADYLMSIKHLMSKKIKRRGEGAIPVDMSAAPQTMMSLQYGGRLRTMSCSDKICKWNVLGLQGSLLTHFIEPIYLSTISFGDLFIYGHISRALFDRLLQRLPKNDSWLPVGYKFRTPELGHGFIPNLPPHTEKSNPASINWMLTDSRVEVVDGTNGKLLTDAGNGEQTISRISKRVFFSHFHKLCEKFKKHDVTKLRVYSAAKKHANEYQHAKDKLLQAFEKCGYGVWLTKPNDLQQFTLK